jgi:hypothetical protein
MVAFFVFVFVVVLWLVNQLPTPRAVEHETTQS